MIKKFISTVLLLSLVFLNIISAQNKIDYGNQAFILNKMLDKFHYDPIVLNDKTSADIFESFIKDLDPYHMYFTYKDIKQLKAYEKKIDNEILNQSDEFLLKTTKLFKQRLIDTDTLISTLLQKPFDFYENDTLIFERKDTIYFTDDKTEPEVKWKRWLKYQMLYYLYEPVSSVDSTFALSTTELLKKESEIRKKIKIKNKRSIKKILENPMGYENYVASIYLNAIANRYDPHTLYFTGNDKENFKSGLSPEGLSFGITLMENDNGDVYISQLALGGPAWKSNTLHAGDKLVKIKFPGVEVFDLSYSNLYEVEEILASSPSKKMEITVSTANGQIKTVTLYKEKIRLDENLVKSYILKGDKTIGYISLPDFYTNWGNTNINGCANDIAKEIIKLKKENIEGLILDIRFNGGGSMKEALDLAGIFIDEGPLCIYGEKDGKNSTEKDFNRGTIYNGPLVLMINGYSASASEMLTGVLQDYNRAVIVGNKTFGKASMQIVLPLDTTVNAYNISKKEKEAELGFVSVTIEKFYRVTGASHQKIGVKPDIKLPDFLFTDLYSEAKYDFALDNDSVKKRVFFTKLPKLPVNELSDLSQTRVKNDTFFRKINKTYDSISKLYANDKTILLNIDSFRKKEKESFRFVYNLKNYSTRLSLSYSVINNKYDNKVLQSDDIWKESNEVFIKNIREDIYIDESYNIIRDLINLRND